MSNAAPASRLEPAIAAPAPAAVAIAPAKPRFAFIVSPRYDLAFFVLQPVFALVLGALLAYTPLGSKPFIENVNNDTAVGWFMEVLISAHLFAVFFRNYGNPDVFARFKWRFTIVPALLGLTLAFSLPALVAASVVAIYWDVYHSAMQTFGLGRIYDARSGADVARSRRLDFGLNLVLFIGPIVAGATFLPYIDFLGNLQPFGDIFLTRVPLHARTWQQPIAWAMTVLGVGYVAYYVVAYRNLAANGHVVSRTKVLLYASTGLTSLVAWGFNPMGQAFVIVNLFHAVQYLALVWWSEKKGIEKLFFMQGRRFGRQVAFAGFLAVTAAYGIWTLGALKAQWSWAVAVTVSLMHFWSDGFIWSVRKKHV